MGSSGSKSSSPAKPAKVKSKPSPKKDKNNNNNNNNTDDKKDEKDDKNKKPETGPILQVEKLGEEGSDIPDTLPEYPEPTPAKNDLFFKDGYFTDVDREAAKVPANAASSFDNLIKHVTGPHTEDAKKIRAILVWYTKQDVKQMRFPPKVEPNTPMWYMKKIQDQEMTVGVFFTLICRKAGIPCVIIRGLVKALMYEVGDRDTVAPAAWVAVYVDGDWRHIQPLWSVHAVVGFQKGGKVLIDNSKTLTAQREQSQSGADVSYLREYYIFTPADQLIWKCFPNNEEWQLLKKPITKDDFLDMPKLSPEEFFGSKFSFKTKPHGVHTSEDGVCTVSIKPPDINMATMVSHLFYHEKKSDMSWEQASAFGSSVTPDKFVFKNRDLEKGEMEFEVRCPAVGVYELHLYGGVNNNDSHLCVFRLDCDSIQEDCKPYPSVPPIGYGPGPEIFSVGLKPKTHKKGRINISINKNINIQFKKTVKNVTENKIFKSELKSGEGKQIETSQWVSNKTSKKNYNIEVNPKKSGEYVLEVKAKDKGEDDSQFENVCNYLIEVEGKKRSKHLDKITRDNLRAALKTNDIGKIELALAKFEERDMEDTDGLAEKAYRKLKFLKLRKDLNDAVCRQRIDLLEQAIDAADKSEFKEELKYAIDRAKDELARLRELEAENGTGKNGNKRAMLHKTPPLDARTLLEIKQYKKPPVAVYDVMKAFLLILGEKMLYVQDWENIVMSLSKTDRRSILKRSRLLKVDEIKEKSLTTAEKILSEYSKQDIRENSVCVAAFHDWSNQVIDLAKKAKKESEPEPDQEQDEESESGAGADAEIESGENDNDRENTPDKKTTSNLPPNKTQDKRGKVKPGG